MTAAVAEQGINVVEETNADQLYDVTTIFIYNGKPYTVRYLSQLFNLENPRVYNRYDPNAAYDIAVAIGEDWAATTHCRNTGYLFFHFPRLRRNRLSASM